MALVQQGFLFDEDEFFRHDGRGCCEQIGVNSVILRGFALPKVAVLIEELGRITQVAPFRQMQTAGGHTMSVAMTNCGEWGWLSDEQGYRYTQYDPVTAKPWPTMPAPLLKLAGDAAAAAGFEDFRPNACLINRYRPGSKMSLHQDKNEQDFKQPIVSVSLGIPAVFLFGGHERSDRPAKHPLFHGDIMVWGGVDRLRYHGVMPLKEARHPVFGANRINLTFRKAR